MIFFCEQQVVITHKGCMLLTSLPRTVEEVESWMRGEGGAVETVLKAMRHYTVQDGEQEEEDETRQGPA